MILAESLIDLISRKDMFESSNPKGNGNGREDEERQKGGTKVLSVIQLVEGVHGRNNIESVYRSALAAPLEMLEGRKIDMNPVDLLVGLPPMRDVGCASNFGGTVMIQNGQLKRVKATSERVNRGAYKLELEGKFKVNPMFNMESLVKNQTKKVSRQAKPISIQGCNEGIARICGEECHRSRNKAHDDCEKSIL
ncbi:hypothetical protein Goshw_000231 [Gossypium schwendimanii]|uniref:Uncharacterized protein n=1 Tax=Gossypium schwendimanii TaxID=34291 RepID=A0A7J9N7W9_GOSSC|nr:hypothetical protein [Gossypium schwendimanii]